MPYKCTYTLKTIDQTIELLKQFKNDNVEWSCSELARKIGWSIVKVHKILVSLRQGEILQYDNKSHKYHVGMTLFELAASAINQKNFLLSSSYPHMYKMVNETGFVATLAIRDDLEIVYVDTIESKTNIRITAKPGTRLPVYATAIGKAILSLLPESIMEDILSRINFTAYTHNTIISVEKLKEEFSKIHLNGYAINNQESSLGVNAVAAAIIDFMGRPVAGVSLGWPTFMASSNSEIHRIGNIVSEYAKLISKDIGGGFHKEVN